MTEDKESVDEDLAPQEAELLPPREAMSTLEPLPVMGPQEDDFLMPVDPKPGHP
jgi:hypothetical protein